MSPKCHQNVTKMSPTVTKCHRGVTRCHEMSRGVTRCHGMSRRFHTVTNCHQLSPTVTKLSPSCHQNVTKMSPNVTKCHRAVTSCHRLLTAHHGHCRCDIDLLGWGVGLKRFTLFIFRQRCYDTDTDSGSQKVQRECENLSTSHLGHAINKRGTQKNSSDLSWVAATRPKSGEFSCVPLLFIA